MDTECLEIIRNLSLSTRVCERVSDVNDAQRSTEDKRVRAVRELPGDMKHS